jgi:hypothetical protein
MREITLVALLIGLVVVGASAAVAETQTPSPAEEPSTNADAPKEPMTTEQARETLTDLLFSDSIERIDFQATTYEEGTALVTTSADKIIEMGLPLFGNNDDVVARGLEVIRALDSETARGMYMTFGKDKQTIFVRSQSDARMLGEVVGTAMTIIYKQFGAGISYQDKASKLFHKVRTDPEDSASILDLCLETVEFVQGLPSKERADYFR